MVYNKTFIGYQIGLAPFPLVIFLVISWFLDGRLLACLRSVPELLDALVALVAERRQVQVRAGPVPHICAWGGLCPLLAPGMFDEG